MTLFLLDEDAAMKFAWRLSLVHRLRRLRGFLAIALEALAQ